MAKKKKQTDSAAQQDFISKHTGKVLAKVVAGDNMSQKQNTTRSHDTQAALVIADIWDRLQKNEISFSYAEVGYDLKTDRVTLDEDLMYMVLAQCGYAPKYIQLFIDEFKETCDEEGPLVVVDQRKCRIFAEIDEIPAVVKLMTELDAK